jgi:hypothetical protein
MTSLASPLPGIVSPLSLERSKQPRDIPPGHSMRSNEFITPIVDKKKPCFLISSKSVHYLKALFLHGSSIAHPPMRWSFTVASPSGWTCDLYRWESEAKVPQVTTSQSQMQYENIKAPMTSTCIWGGGGEMDMLYMRSV